jgi:hypothetical protein
MINSWAEKPPLTPPETMNASNHQLALEAAFQLNKELLNDESFCGYEGSLEEFELLCAECLYIIENEMRVVGVTQWVVDKFYENQLEISEGNRYVGYFAEN